MNAFGIKFLGENIKILANLPGFFCQIGNRKNFAPFAAYPGFYFLEII